MSRTLDVYWQLKPVINPTWYDDDEGSTHSPPDYLIAVREVGVGLDEWSNADTEFQTVYQPGREGGKAPDGLKGNTEYEVAVKNGYYGESGYRIGSARTQMSPARDVVVGFESGDGVRAVVSWQASQDGSQKGYKVVLRQVHGNKRVGDDRVGADAVSASFSELEDGRWYVVRVRAVGDGNHRSAARSCYFQHGVAESPNTVGAGIDIAGSGCTAG